MNLYRFVYIIASLLLLPVVFLTNHALTLGDLINKLPYVSDMNLKLPDIHNYISYGTYLIIVLGINYFITSRFKKLPNKEEIKTVNIQKIYPASENFLPTFFAYIFLGLSINNFSTLLIVYFAIVIMCYFGDMYLYNPIFYLFSYRYYYIENQKGGRILILTKKKISKGNTCDFNDIREINNHSFIDIEK